MHEFEMLTLCTLLEKHIKKAVKEAIQEVNDERPENQPTFIWKKPVLEELTHPQQEKYKEAKKQTKSK